MTPSEGLWSLSLNFTLSFLSMSSVGFIYFFCNETSTRRDSVGVQPSVQEIFHIERTSSSGMCWYHSSSMKNMKGLSCASREAALVLHSWKRCDTFDACKPIQQQSRSSRWMRFPLGIPSVGQVTEMCLFSTCALFSIKIYDIYHRSSLTTVLSIVRSSISLGALAQNFKCFSLIIVHSLAKKGHENNVKSWYPNSFDAATLI